MSIIVPIDADVSRLVRKLRGAEMSLGTFAKAGVLAAGAAGIGALVMTMKVGVDEFMQAEKVTAQTNAVLKSTGGIANVTAKKVDELASAIMAKSGMDDEAVKSAENLLLTFTKVRDEAGKGNDIFSQATKVTADLSVAFHKDLNSSAILVGKALNDPIKGLSALGRVGIQFSEDQKKTIKALIESGDTMKAQKIILHELETQVGGSAAAYGRTLPGQLAIAKETFRNLAGSLVSTFMPALARGATALGRFVSQLSQRQGLKARIEFVFETAGQLASRFWSWWSQPQMKKVRSPTSGIHFEFVKPGSERVADFVDGLEMSIRRALMRQMRNLGYAIPQALFGGAHDNGAVYGARFAKWMLIWINPNLMAQKMGEIGRQLGASFWQGLSQWFDDNPGLAVQKLKEWITSAADSVGGALGSAINAALGRSSRRLLNPEGTARILTRDMRAAIQAARQGMQGLGSTLGGMLSEATQAKLSKAGVFGTQAQLDAKGRALQDRQFAITEKQLRDNLAAQTAGSAEYAQAQLDLDQFLYEKESTLRQRAVDEANAASQKKIDDLVATFNAGGMSARTFAAELDKILGPNVGKGMGKAFAQAFDLAYKSIKNAARDITNIGLGIGLGPDIGAPGSASEGGATASARAAYLEAVARWRERVSTLRERVKTLKDEDASAAAIEKAQKRVQAAIASRPNRSDYGLALGGIVTGRRVIAGEAGAEAVIPLSSDRAAVMMRKAFGHAVGDTNYYVTINAGVGTDPNELGRVVVKAIKTYERRNGPVFASA